MSEFSVKRNSNYTVSVIDGQGRNLCFRDVCGNDLEFLEQQILRENTTFDNLIAVVQYLLITDVDISCYPVRVIEGIFSILRDEILINISPKYAWLQNAYIICDGSFAGITELEKIPLTKFAAMMQIHSELRARK